MWKPDENYKIFHKFNTYVSANKWLPDIVLKIVNFLMKETIIRITSAAVKQNA